MKKTNLMFIGIAIAAFATAGLVTALSAAAPVFATKTCTIGGSTNPCNENNVGTPAAHCTAGARGTNSPHC